MKGDKLVDLVNAQIKEIEERQILLQERGIWESSKTTKSILKQRYDPSNISGAKLAEIGREVLAGGYNPGPKKRNISGVDYESLKWLDDRIKEVCEKGRI